MARERSRLSAWLDEQPAEVKAELDELAALDLADKDPDGPGEG